LGHALAGAGVGIKLWRFGDPCEPWRVVLIPPACDQWLDAALEKQINWVRDTSKFIK
jgi:hypothetical protein